jgi:hypothetical protein
MRYTVYVFHTLSKTEGKDAKLVITASQISFADSKTLSMCGTNKVYLKYEFPVSCVGNNLNVFAVLNK